MIRNVMEPILKRCPKMNLCHISKAMGANVRDLQLAGLTQNECQRCQLIGNHDKHCTRQHSHNNGPVSDDVATKMLKQLDPTMATIASNPSACGLTEKRQCSN